MESETDNRVRQVRPGSRLAVAAVILAVCAIPLYVASIHRIDNLHHSSLQSCLVNETPIYRTVNSLCGIVPTAAALCGILAVIRSIRAAGPLRTSLTAVSGIAAAVLGFAVYFVTLAQLASRNAH